MSMPAKKPSRKPASNPKAAAKRGRPTAYLLQYAEQARRLAMLGLTDAEMAEFFSVSERTLNTWKKAHPDFLQSLKAGKIEADTHVASGLYQSAIGGHVVTESREQKAPDGSITRTTETKQVPPNVTAQLFWLKNRQSTKWRDKHEIQQDVSMTGVATVDELNRMYDDMMRQARERQARVLAERGIFRDDT
jgi:hypothetical protein